MSLFRRIFLLNALLLVGATALLLLGPVTVSTPVLFTETLILTAGLAVTLVANAALLRVGLGPVRRLTRTMTTTDLLHPGPRPEPGGSRETAELIRAFNAMLDRLESERGQSAAAALSAQEAERRRVAQELHDEVGQTLTAVLLELRRVTDRAPAALVPDLQQVQETARDSLDEVRRIARRLRPGVLTELGLLSALRALASELGVGPEPVVRYRFDPALPALGEPAELVVYRVAQESMTNVLRHAGATRLDLTLTRVDDSVRLLVRDDGHGITGAADGAGIRGMRERALLVNARLDVGPAIGGGTEVSLTVPVAASAEAVVTGGSRAVAW